VTARVLLSGEIQKFDPLPVSTKTLCRVFFRLIQFLELFEFLNRSGLKLSFIFTKRVLKT